MSKNSELRIGTTASDKPFKLPIDAATQTFAFIARKGAGKTYAAGVLVELLIGADVQVVILDTVGNWYGLRIASDGKGPGLDVAVLGGLRGDIPLEPTGGALIADLVVEMGRSLILDISQFSKADRQRFAAAFAERLWLKKKSEKHPTPLHLVIEESQLIIPESVRGDTAVMVGIYEEIIRLGRNYGIGVTMITQRPQSVNKEVLNQTECLFVLQVNGAHERKALKEWIVHQGIETTLLDELPGLPIGTAYVWSPQWLRVLEKVKIAAKTTFDASATPKVGQKQTRRELAPLDLVDLQAKMAATIEKAAASDPRKLQARIAQLEREAAAAGKRTSSPAHAKPAAVDPKVIERAVHFAVRQRDIEWSNAMKAFQAELHGSVRGLLNHRWTPPASNGHVTLLPGPARLLAAHETSRQVLPRKERAITLSQGDDAGEVKVNASMRRMLAILLQRKQMGQPSTDDRTLAALSGIKRTGGTFGTYVSRLNTAGLIEGGNQDRRITDAGEAAAGDVEALPRGKDLVDYYKRTKLNAKQGEMLDVILERGEVSNADLAAAVGITYGAGTFGTYLSRMRGIGLIQKGDPIRLTAALLEGIGA